jgi:xanthine dehydrogenase accessory factor
MLAVLFAPRHNSTMTISPIQTLGEWISTNIQAILVRISAAAGSTPRERGAWMAVTGSAVTGTIGGGRLEWDAVESARTMLLNGTIQREEVIALGPAIGQCCGGRVTLDYAQLTPALHTELAEAARKAAAARPAVFIYGAGHVGRALARALAPLPFAVTLIDNRPEELALAEAPGVTLLNSESPVAVAESAPTHAAHVVMTHSHALDSLIAQAVLERGDFAYLGLIGSATKRAAFLKAFCAMGLSEAQLARITCPIGGSLVADKRPEIIAALTAAEILATVLR